MLCYRVTQHCSTFREAQGGRLDMEKEEKTAINGGGKQDIMKKKERKERSNERSVYNGFKE